jgi:hypothetical protein
MPSCSNLDSLADPAGCVTPAGSCLSDGTVCSTADGATTCGSGRRIMRIDESMGNRLRSEALVTSTSPRRAGNGITPANTIVAAEFVEEHNAYRCEVGLEPLVWDEGLAAASQAWADHQAVNAQCGMAHSTNGWRGDKLAELGSGLSGWIGENVAWLSGYMPSGNPQIKDGRMVTGMWASEKADFALGASGDSCTKPTGGVVGHYTQIVWHATQKVGCGVSQCGDGATLFVCQYYPGGNMMGELVFCKDNLPSGMPSCSNLDSLADPAGCVTPAGSCLSDGTVCSTADGATTCGSGGGGESSSGGGGGGSDGSSGGGGDDSTAAGPDSDELDGSWTDMNFTCSACGYGTFKPTNGSMACTECSSGKYHTQLAVITEETCDVACPERGSYWSPSDNECLQCPGNHSDSLPGSGDVTDCICNKGYTGPDGDVCISCPPGSYKAVNGSSQCIECPRGKYSPDEAATHESSCQECAQGKYSDSPGLSQCRDCEAGKYADQTGSVRCEYCGAGKYSGNVSAVSETTCTECACGKYSTQVGRTSEDSCLECSAGSFAIGTGNTASSDCVECLAGTYSEIAGQCMADQCIDCACGKYSELSGSTSCTECSAGKFAVDTGNSAEASCEDCDAGKYLETRGQCHTDNCTDCAAGKYSDVTGSASCDICDKGKFSGPGLSSCIDCIAGKYANVPSATACTDCGLGKYSSVPAATSSGSQEHKCLFLRVCFFIYFKLT